ncbi:MAG TPA: carboxypeptidase-like regulatory domain-containing protein [Bryobacteraceae bacterium]|jgi:hypothetical protein|nr:carboxypeptidase-like regulatory domain-containing protein [Bryobacteraceae bacterium]
MPKPAFTFLLLAASALQAKAGVIRGVVVEKSTGYSLAHAAVTLEPVPGGNLPGRTMLTSEAGGFAFDKLPAGAYVLKASRRGFMPGEYGQKRWNSAGTVIVVEGEASTFSARIPLTRYGSISGTVRDSNEVGIGDQDVAAYTNTQPPHFVTRARTDERGIFRIPGLDPGSYLVRTAGNNDEDRSYVPTFSRQTLRVEEARTVAVYPDEDTNDGDVRPIAGRLFEISGNAAPLPTTNYGWAVTVTLASDTGRLVTQGQVFHFPALAPVRYELYAEAREAAPGTRVLGGYTEFPLDRNLSIQLPLFEQRESQLALQGAGETVSAAGFFRRKDLAGVGPVQAVKLGVSTGIALLPGRWEILVGPPAGYYVSRFSPVPRDNPGPPEGWNTVEVGRSFGFSRFIATLSNGVGGIHGTVKISNAAAGGAPVFLELYDPATRQRLLDLRETRADMRGNYRFDGLPPGEYRVLATYEYSSPDPNAFDAALPRSLRVESSTNPQVDLELYGIP